MGLTLGCVVLAAEGSGRRCRRNCSRPRASWETVFGGRHFAAIVAAASPSRVPALGGLAVALAAVAMTLGGWWMQAADPKPAPAKPDDPIKAATTFEKRPFWWGSDAFRHNGWILDSDLSTDGKLLATASWDSFVVWEAATGKPLMQVQESEGVSGVGRDRISAVRLSPDGKQLATANKTLGTVRVWEVATGKLLKTIAWDQEAEKAALGELGAQPFERRKHSPDYYLALEYLGNNRLYVQSTYCTAVWDTAGFSACPQSA